LKTIKTTEHGGARPGAGRKKGAATTRTREIADKAVTEGQSPLEFMLQVMRDENAEWPHRLDMAKAAASYIHPRLSSVDAKVQGDVGLRVEIVRFGDS
jgi:hypothetical protein